METSDFTEPGAAYETTGAYCNKSVVLYRFVYADLSAGGNEDWTTSYFGSDLWIFFQFSLHQCGSSPDRTRISGQFMEKAPVMCNHFDSHTECDRFQMDHLVSQDL